jgi:hypothetical protein
MSIFLIQQHPYQCRNNQSANQQHPYQCRFEGRIAPTTPLPMQAHLDTFPTTPLPMQDVDILEPTTPLPMQASGATDSNNTPTNAGDDLYVSQQHPYQCRFSIFAEPTTPLPMQVDFPPFPTTPLPMQVDCQSVSNNTPTNAGGCYFTAQQHPYQCRILSPNSLIFNAHLTC